MKDCDENKESSYLKYWDISNLYGLAMSQTLPVNNFESIEDTSQFNEEKKSYKLQKLKSYNEESNEGSFLKVDVKYPEKSHERQNDLPFLPKRMKIEKVEKLAGNLRDKIEYLIHIKNLTQALNHGLVLKVFRVIKFNQNTWLKTYIAMNTRLRQKAENKIEE